MKKTDYHYEVCDQEGNALEDGFQCLELAIEFAEENGGYSINQVWFEVITGFLAEDIEGETLSAEVVWTKGGKG